MKLASFNTNNVSKFGIVTDRGVIDLTEKLNHKYADLKSFIANDGFKELNNIDLEEVDYSINEITYTPLIANPNKIICIGVNYDEHRIEVNREKVDYPTIFFRLAESQIGHNEDMIVPKVSSRLDFEGEVAVIIGKEGKNIDKEDVYDYIVGYSCYNDGTIRDWQVHTSQWGPGKNFDGTGAFGPWMITKDEIKDDEVLQIETRLNGEVMQSSSTDMLIFPIRELVSYISTFTTLRPGDVIVTGTPGGVGNKRNPQVFMKDGDTVEVEVSKIGILSNRVKAD